MKTRVNTNKIVPGVEVAFNGLSDALWFTVVECDGFTIKVRDARYPHHATQNMDVCYVCQIRNPSEAVA